MPSPTPKPPRSLRKCTCAVPAPPAVPSGLSPCCRAPLHAHLATPSAPKRSPLLSPAVPGDAWRSPRSPLPPAAPVAPMALRSRYSREASAQCQHQPTTHTHMTHGMCGACLANRNYSSRNWGHSRERRICSYGALHKMCGLLPAVGDHIVEP
jgi:hypothetical protein